MGVAMAPLALTLLMWIPQVSLAVGIARRSSCLRPSRIAISA